MLGVEGVQQVMLQVRFVEMSRTDGQETCISAQSI